MENIKSIIKQIRECNCFKQLQKIQSRYHGHTEITQEINERSCQLLD